MQYAPFPEFADGARVVFHDSSDSDHSANGDTGTVSGDSRLFPYFGLEPHYSVDWDGDGSSWCSAAFLRPVPREPSGSYTIEQIKHAVPRAHRSYTIEQIKHAVTREPSGSRYWFSPENLRFFSSRILATTYGPDSAGNVYFVSSEQRGDYRIVAARRYTVRKYQPHTNSIETVGEFQEYATAALAKAAAREAARA